MKMVDKFLDIMGFLEKEDEYEEEAEGLYNEPQFFEENKRRKGQLVAIHNHTRDNVKVVVIEPQNFDEAQLIADNLKNKKAVIINLENAEYELGKRLIDFVGGTAYAIGGTMQKIGQGIILVVPPNIDIGGELKEKYSDQQEDVFSWVSKFSKKGDL
ncbi:MAG: cell division inhibitor SepF [Clostridia bacterium]|jgi:cell division inhibitor SepF|nr:cell division inhibitor SepF [Clostridia bacterium]MDN5322298.1 cell division inhibitor SepF [Clostridia bacterium]